MVKTTWNLQIYFHKRVFIFLFPVLFFGMIPCLSQNIDSIEIILGSEKLNSEDRLKWMNELSWEYLEINPLKAQKLAGEAIELAHKENSQSQLLIAYNRLGRALYNRNKLDSAKSVLEKAISLNEGSDFMVGGILQELGNVEADLGNYETAMNYYFRALKEFEKRSDLSKIGATLSNIGALYTNLDNYDKMLEYCEKALAIFRKTGNKMGIANNLTNIADYYYRQGDSVKNLQMLTEAQKIYHELHATVNEVNVLISIGDYYLEFQKNPDKAIEVYEQAISLLTPGDNKNLWMENYRKISLAWYRKTNYDKALEYAEKAMTVTDPANKDYMRFNYYLLVYYYISVKNSDEATNAFDNYVELTDKVYHENQKKSLGEIEIKYETEKRKQQILQLENDKKTANLMGLLGFTIFLSVVVVLIFRQRTAIQKRKLSEQVIIRLQQEKQLAASQALLEGESTERKRLARDLHDGLGGMLSVIKLNLTNMKGNIVMPESDVQTFQNALQMLDSSIRELRLVAHNLMPETLVLYGLKPALTDFCRNVELVKFHFFGEDRRIEEKYEVALYRIFLELVNNAIKHSKAESINVQVILEEKRANLVVQDNGIGFDLLAIEKSETLGLKSIKSRVESLGGEIHIYTEPGKGTEVQVNFNF